MSADTYTTFTAKNVSDEQLGYYRTCGLAGRFLGAKVALDLYKYEPFRRYAPERLDRCDNLFMWYIV